MQTLLYSRLAHIAVAVVLIAIAVFFLVRVLGEKNQTVVTTTVEVGPVTQVVAVSGVIEADELANLAFPVAGIVESVSVKKGDVVAAGDALITLNSNSLLADRTEAGAALRAAEADRDELIAGPRDEARAVTSSEVANAEQNLLRIEREQAEKVAAAKRTLNSSSLTAISLKNDEDATPPTVSGTYTCESTGTYELEVYNSAADSGYSYRLSGLESGTYSVYTDQSAPFGTCGLRIQFADERTYANSHWQIAIPNTISAAYVTNQNAFNLAVEQFDNTIAAAEEALELARRQATLSNATPRTEALIRANAAVAQAAARLDRIDAELDDRVLRAPFAGIITTLDILPGETVTTAPVVTLLADSQFELIARIPEIDVTKIEVGQLAEVVFDARSTELLNATVVFVSPTATEIDGVAYYEATLALTEPPSWLRSGLNADVNIIVAESTDVLRVPKRFVTETDGVFQVRRYVNGVFATTTVDTGLVGNDGFIEIIGVAQGDIIAAP